jgi:hypothetical protein
VKFRTQCLKRLEPWFALYCPAMAPLELMINIKRGPGFESL